MYGEVEKEKIKKILKIKELLHRALKMFRL